MARPKLPPFYDSTPIVAVISMRYKAQTINRKFPPPYDKFSGGGSIEVEKMAYGVTQVCRFLSASESTDDRRNLDKNSRRTYFLTDSSQFVDTVDSQKQIPGPHMRQARELLERLSPAPDFVHIPSIRCSTKMGKKKRATATVATDLNIKNEGCATGMQNHRMILKQDRGNGGQKSHDKLEKIIKCHSMNWKNKNYEKARKQPDPALCKDSVQCTHGNDEENNHYFFDYVSNEIVRQCLICMEGADDKCMEE
mmetsp:Transcript_11388/g.18245  ORF Transcript_11388/g.18245 Transcript_11388/m.18245 type:complete len:252 (+) Transcript_11388:445-1200(+)